MYVITVYYLLIAMLAVMFPLALQDRRYRHINGKPMILFCFFGIAAFVYALISITSVSLLFLTLSIVGVAVLYSVNFFARILEPVDIFVYGFVSLVIWPFSTLALLILLGFMVLAGILNGSKKAGKRSATFPFIPWFWVLTLLVGILIYLLQTY